MIDDEKILEALIRCGSIRKAAAAVPCGISTVRDRLKDTDFRQKYEAAKAAVLSDATDEISAALGGAVDCLCEVVADAENPATVRVSASDALLRHGLRYIEQGNVLKRLSELEERLSNE